MAEAGGLPALVTDGDIRGIKTKCSPRCSGRRSNNYCCDFYFCDAVTRTLAKCARRCPTKYSFAVGHGRSLDRSSCPLRVETFLRCSELASQHHRTGVAYESVRRQLDLFGLQFRASNDRDAALKALAEISAKLDAIADAEPTVPQRMYDRIQYTPADDSEFAKLPGKTSSQ